MAEKVQSDPLGGQHAAHRAAQDGDAVARRHRRAIRPFDVDLDGRIDQAEGELGDVEPGDGSGLTRHQRRLGARRRRHDRVRGEVSGTAKILEQGRPHDRLDHKGRQTGEGHNRAP